MAKQTFSVGQTLTAAQMTSLQQTAMLGGAASAKTASYTLVAADAGTAISMSSASATTITVNTALFAAGDTVQITNLGAGVCTITAGTATVNTSATLALAQYESGTLDFTSTSAAIFIKGAGAPASGGAGNMVQIATGTLSGASVVISGLSSYTDILVFMYGTTYNTANGQVYMRLNATSTNHNTRGQRINGVSTISYLGAMADSDFYLSVGGTVTRTNSTNNYLAKLTNCKNPGFTDVDIQTTFLDTGSNQVLGMAKGIYDKSEAVSSITLRAGGGTWAGGDYYVWGA
jgi:hypothetical protein